MPVEISHLDQMQLAYKSAVDAWVAAIHDELALASVEHSVAELDQWEAAGFREEDLRAKARAAKTEYESALREKFFSL